MRILGWAAWVDTETGTEIYSSKDMEWEDLPDDGIIFIMLYKDTGDGQESNISYPTYTESLAGNDYYWKAPHHSGTIYGSGNDSLAEIKARYPGADIKRGKWVPHSLFEEVSLEALKYVW